MTPRDRRVLFIGATVALGAVLALRVFPAAVRQLMEEGSRLAAERTLLGATEQALAQRQVLEDSAVVLTTAVGGMGPQLLSGASAAAALSDLSGRLGRSPGLQHARLVGLTAVPDSSRAGPLRRVSAELRVQTDFRGIAEVLAALMEDDATLVVERMRVTAGEPVVPEPQVEQLEVEVLVTGWYGRTGGRDDGGASVGPASESRGRDDGGVAPTPNVPSSHRPVVLPSRRPVESANDLLRLARAGAPFRSSRRPASLRFGEALPPAPPPAAPKPVLLLTGILWGREPAAIVEGVPGQEGAVVLRGGESVGSVRVIRVDRSRVLLSGFDTTWTLTVRQPW